MKLMKVREGRTQTEVLATIADFQYNKDKFPKQKDIVKVSPLSKGAVSNNCNKLLKSNLIIEENHNYRINKEKLLELYREHIEGFLSRESKTEKFKDLITDHNEIRTQTKKELREIFDNNELIFDILINSLISSLDEIYASTLREVFLKTDCLISELTEHIVSNKSFKGKKSDDWEKIKPLLMLTVSLNHFNPQIEEIGKRNSFLSRYLPGNVREKDMISYLKGGDE